MTKRAKREPNGPLGFPASWNIESCGMSSFGAYRNAMEFCQEVMERKTKANVEKESALVVEHQSAA